MTDRKNFEAKVDELLHAYGHSIGQYGNNPVKRLNEARAAVLAAYDAGREGQPAEPPVMGDPGPMPPPVLTIHLDADAVSLLLGVIGMDEEGPPTSHNLHIGNGHSGTGLYVSLSEYPDEGAVFIAPLDSHRNTHPAPKAVEAAGFVIVRETVVTELSGRPRLGYTLLAPMERGATGVFATGEQAHAFLTAEDRPLGWVVARLDQVLAASPARVGEGEK